MSAARGPASRRGYEAMGNGIDSYRYQMMDCSLRCGDALHDDAKYAAEVMRWRRLAAPSINRHWKRWEQLRDGYTDPVMGFVEGFWLDEAGKPLVAGARIPKGANIGMEGAIEQILHLDGLFWVKDRQRSSTKSAYAKVIEKRVDGAEDDEDDEPE